MFKNMLFIFIYQICFFQKQRRVKGRSTQREARKRETADAQMEKGEKDEHFKLMTMTCTILCYKNYKKFVKK